ncbi:hypothetical protein C1646_674779 [Rhizophagus diaphanus]|nr:hypothetical protein C1646_674779 [Rhizophagus diaphanus] [Rhizophagus sp. MUCL 43196]
MSVTCDSDDIVLIVEGKRYPAKIFQLRSYPHSMLGAMFQERNEELLHPVNGNEYIIDRDDFFFRHILDFYKNGELIFPEAISDSPQSNPMLFARFMYEVDYYLLPVHDSQMQNSIQQGLANISVIVHLIHLIINDAVSKLVIKVNICVDHNLGHIRIHIEPIRDSSVSYSSLFKEEYMAKTI